MEVHLPRIPNLVYTTLGILYISSFRFSDIPFTVYISMTGHFRQFTVLDHDTIFGYTALLIEKWSVSVLSHQHNIRIFPVYNIACVGTIMYYVK